GRLQHRVEARSGHLRSLVDGAAADLFGRTSGHGEEPHRLRQGMVDADATPQEELPDKTYLEEFYVKTAEFPAGFMTEYTESMITTSTRHQALATGFPIGKRFKSARVQRSCDANFIHLGHEARADGRWRVYV